MATWNGNEELNLQGKYDKLEEGIKDTVRKFGIKRETIKTDDKLRKETKQLIEKR